jgi:hypothetical protein
MSNVCVRFKARPNKIMDLNYSPSYSQEIPFLFTL